MLFDCASSQLILVHFHCAGNLLCQHNTLIDLDDIIDSFQQLFWFESTFSLFQSLWTPYDVQYLVSSFFLAKWSRFSIEIIPGNISYIDCFVPNRVNILTRLFSMSNSVELHFTYLLQRTPRMITFWVFAKIFKFDLFDVHSQHFKVLVSNALRPYFTFKK